jgi:uncharacterized delta-60 repeat protein
MKSILVPDGNALTTTGSDWGRGRRIRLLAALALALLVALVATSTALAAGAGDLDTTFSNDGKLTNDFGANDVANAVAVQPDGKIVTAGYTNSGSSGNYDFALARYNADGTLDTDFSSNGKLITDFGGSDDYAYAVAIQPMDDKIVVAGYSNYNGSYDFALARYNPDGSMDTTFNYDGMLTTDFGGSDGAYALALQPDGQIVVAGDSNAGSSSYNFAVARYNANGSLDTSFDRDGKRTTDFGGTDEAYALAIQPGDNGDMKIVAGGYSGSDFALARYNPDGSLDTSFSSDGKLTTDLGGTDKAYALAIQPDDNKIVASGYSGTDFALARYNTDGTLDSDFSGDGKVTTDFGGTDVANALVIQPDANNANKIVAGGYSGSDFALARYNLDGSLDTNFSGDGKVTTDFGGDDGIDALAIQPDDNKIVAAGYSNYSGSYDFALARYLGENPPDDTAPTVESVTPANGATNVSRDTNITATFSEAMDPATLNNSTVTLVAKGSTTPVDATVTVSDDGKTVTLDPSSKLAKKTKYKATIKGGDSGAKDLAGNPLANNYTWSFTTGRS